MKAYKTLVGPCSASCCI